MKDLEDWYQIDAIKWVPLDKEGILRKHFGLSLVKILEVQYPNHHFQFWKFRDRVPRTFWQLEKNQKEFMEWLFHKIGMKKLDDWYDVTNRQIRENGGRGLLNQYGDSLSRMVQSVYPEHPWIPSEFNKAWNFMKM